MTNKELSTEATKIELRNCHCGSAAKFHSYKISVLAPIIFRIKCNSCLMQTDTKFDKQELADCWNSRPDSACEKGNHFGTVLRIIRAGFQNQPEVIEAYTNLLAEKVEGDGDKSTADRLRKYAKQEFGNQVQALEAGGAE